MRLWETIGVAVRPMDGESLDTLDTLQVHEAAEGNTRSASREAEHLRPLFAVERLECAPPPYDDRVGARVAVVLRCGPPLVDVDVGRAGDE